jgi:hypothetical protein
MKGLIFFEKSVAEIKVLAKKILCLRGQGLWEANLALQTLGLDEVARIGMDEPIEELKRRR